MTSLATWFTTSHAAATAPNILLRLQSKVGDGLSGEHGAGRATRAEIKRIIRRDLTLGDEFIDEMRVKLGSFIGSQQHIEREMAASIWDELKKLEVREECLLALPADGDPPTAEVRARLAIVQLQCKAMAERPARVDATLEQQTRKVDAQLNLLRAPADLYANALGMAR